MGPHVGLILPELVWLKHELILVWRLVVIHLRLKIHLLTELTHVHGRIALVAHYLIDGGLKLWVIIHLTCWLCLFFVSVLIVLRDRFWSSDSFFSFYFQEFIPVSWFSLLVPVEMFVLLVDLLQEILHLRTGVVIFLLVFGADAQI